jgi:hypothetical protein
MGEGKSGRFLLPPQATIKWSQAKDVWEWEWVDGDQLMLELRGPLSHLTSFELREESMRAKFAWGYSPHHRDIHVKRGALG